MGSNRMLYVVGALIATGALLLAPVFLMPGPNPVVVVELAFGPSGKAATKHIRIELLRNKAPATVDHFLQLIEKKQFNGTIIHDIPEGTQARFGIFLPGYDVKANLAPPEKNEAGNGLRNDRGTLALIRYEHGQDAMAEYVINLKRNPKLDSTGDKKGLIEVAVFGRIIEEGGVLEQLSRASTEELQDEKSKISFGFAPDPQILIRSITLEK